MATISHLSGIKKNPPDGLLPVFVRVAHTGECATLIYPESMKANTKANETRKVVR